MGDKELQKSVALWIGLAAFVGAFIGQTFFDVTYGDSFYFVVGICIGGATVWSAAGAALDRVRTNRKDQDER